MPTVSEYAADIALWAADHFIVDRRYTGGKWKHGPSPIDLSPYQAEILREATKDKYAAVVWSEPGKSGKSTLAAAMAVHTALHRQAAEVYCLAADLKGASRVFRAAEYCVKHNKALRPKMLRNRILFRDGYIESLPADYRGEAGSDPSLVIFDECEHYLYDNYQRLLAEFKVSPTRASSKHLYLGYGGWEGESVLWQNLLSRRETGQPVLPHIVNSDGSPAVWDCGATLVFWSDVLRQEWQTSRWVSTQEQNLTPADFKRIILNQFVPVSSKVFVEPIWWQSCYDSALLPLAPGDKDTLVLALDLAMGGVGADTISLVAVAKYGDGVAVRYAQSWESDGSRFNYRNTVVPVIQWLTQTYSVAQLCYDPYQAQHLAQTDLKGLCWLDEFSQASERDVADKGLYDLIVSRKLRHYNDQALNDHVMAAGSNVKGENRIRIVKAGRKKIDLCVALSMAAHRCMSLNLPDSAPSQTPKKTVAQVIEERYKDNEIYNLLKNAQQRKNQGYDEPQPTGESAAFRYVGQFAGSFQIMAESGYQVVEAGKVYRVPFWVARNLEQAQGEWEKIITE